MPCSIASRTLPDSTMFWALTLELVIHAGNGLKSWLHGFLSSGLLKPPQNKGLEKSFSICDPKAFKTCSGARELLFNLLALYSLQDLLVIYLHLPQPFASAGTSMFLTRNTPQYMKSLWSPRKSSETSSRKEGQSRVYWLTAAYDCLTPWCHLQASENSTRQAHGLYNYGESPQQELHPYNWWQQA